jgi:hypothetical protein
VLDGAKLRSIGSLCGIASSFSNKPVIKTRPFACASAGRA